MPRTWIDRLRGASHREPLTATAPFDLCLRGMAEHRLRKFAEELLAVAPRFMPWYVPLPKAGKDGSDSGAAGELCAGSRAVSAAAEANALAAARAKERALKERQSKGKDGKVRKLRSGKPSLFPYAVAKPG